MLSLVMLEEGESSRPQAADDAGPRLALLMLLFFSLAVAVMWRLASLQGAQHRQWLTMAAKQHGSQITVQGARGTIYDTAGRTLAVSVPAVSIGAHPNRIADPASVAVKLASVLEINAKDIEQKLRQEKRFVWLARALPHEKKDAVEALKISGVAGFDEFRRYYPQQEIASAILGRVGTDGYGLSGLELAYNSRLSAAQMDLPVRRDARGRLVNAGIWTSGAEKAGVVRGLKLPKDGLDTDSLRREGRDLSLSIDSVVQEIVQKEFRIGAENAKAKDVYGLVMDAESGEILALAQSSAYDPNQAGKLSTEQLRNLVYQNSFEPGSTMKPLVAAAAMDQGLARKNEMMDCENGRYKFSRHIIRDAHPISVVPLSEVLVQSSNICMAKLGARLGKERLYEALESFGFGQVTGLEVKGEAKGILRAVERWRPIDVATHSFGQGVAVTALQMVQAYAALANGGLLVQPTLLKREGEPKVIRRVLSPETADWIGKSLKGVTEGEHGTGKKAKISGVSVYGKTGTAQKAKVNGRGYDPDRVLASFIGFVDGSEVGVDRKLVMLVLVDEPGVKPRWGGTLAGPVFRRSMERILSHLLTQDGAVQTAGIGRSTRAG